MTEQEITQYRETPTTRMRLLSCIINATISVLVGKQGRYLDTIKVIKYFLKYNRKEKLHQFRIHEVEHVKFMATSHLTHLID